MTDRIIVIGAGMGGLAAALDLAAEGREVLLLERAEGPGGKLRRLFPRAGGQGIDSGPTVFTMRWVFEALFERAGARFDERVPCRRCDVLARHAWRPGVRLDLFADEERTVAAIGALSGAADAAAYRRFCRRTRARFENLRDSYIAAPRPSVFELVMRMGPLRLGALFGLGSFTTMWRELERSFSDPRLRQLFGRYATYCGSSPFATPATLMLVAHVERDGVWLVEGGMHRLASALATLVTELGGRIRYGQGVREILVRGGRACGVITEQGEELEAGAVICNADAAALGAGRFGPDARDAVRPVTRPLRSLSAITFSLLARTRGFPLERHNVFFSDDYPEEFRALFGRREVPADSTAYLCAQDRPGTPAGDERLLLLINAPADGDGDGFSKALVTARRAASFSLLADCGLEVEHQGADEIITTPADFEQLFPGTGGALYGRHLHGTLGSFRKPASRTRVPGLYLAGGGAHPGAGIPMAALSGRLAAAAVQGDHGGRGGRARAPSLVTRRAQRMSQWTDGGFPRFDYPVPDNGYQWWYVDAMSDDGRLGLTLIAFVGSVFSPYYASARRRNRGNPENFVALNVALYGRRKRWSLTERGRNTLERSPRELAIGPSTVRWTGEKLEFEINEWTVPFPGRLRGRIRLTPGAMVARDVVLDPRGQHRWWPVAPRSRVEVEMERPDLRWSGHAYFDANRGLEPLESGFVGWNWSRAHIGDTSVLLYEGVPTLGDRFCHALRATPSGELERFDPPALHTLPRGPIWRAPRETRSEDSPRILRTLEDTPFYTRSMLASRFEGQAVTAMHESLDLQRFDARWVQLLLPFRMPRVAA